MRVILIAISPLLFALPSFATDPKDVLTKQRKDIAALLKAAEEAKKMAEESERNFVQLLEEMIEKNMKKIEEIIQLRKKDPAIISMLREIDPKEAEEYIENQKKEDQVIIEFFSNQIAKHKAELRKFK